MNWTKPNFTQWVTIVTIVGSFLAYVWHAENDRVDAKIHQHDMEQRVDSIQTAFSIFMVQFNELQKNRTVTLKQRDEEKRENDAIHYEFGLRLTKVETKFEDLLFYKIKKP